MKLLAQRSYLYTYQRIRFDPARKSTEVLSISLIYRERFDIATIGREPFGSLGHERSTGLTLGLQSGVDFRDVTF